VGNRLIIVNDSVVIDCFVAGLKYPYSSK